MPTPTRQIVMVAAAFFLCGYFAPSCLSQNESPIISSENSIGMQFSLIPAGEFEMGSPETEAGRWGIEHLHQVEITQPYWMGLHEVSQSQFEQVMGFNPSSFSKSGSRSTVVTGMETDNFPVEWVSHDDASEFCSRLSCLPIELAEGRVYRLPTEAEWEKACRAGEAGQVFSFGNSISSNQANIRGDKPYGDGEQGPYLKRTSAIGSYPPNAFGLYDMHGNVAEWCLDRYDRNYYRGSTKLDPVGRLNSRDNCYVIRGGDWNKSGNAARSAQRAPRPDLNNPYSSWRSNDVGFRIVCICRNPNNFTANRNNKEPEAITNDFRMWKDSTGRDLKRKARINDISRKEVVLQYEDESEVKVSISKLSDEDKEFLKSFKKHLRVKSEQMMAPYRLKLRNGKIELATAIDLNRSISDISKSKQAIKKAEKAILKINKQSRDVDAERFRLRKLYVQAQAAADKIASSNIDQRNRAIGSLNSLQAQIEAIELTAKGIDEKVGVERQILEGSRRKYFRIAQQVKNQSLALSREQAAVDRSDIVERVKMELRPILKDIKLAESNVLDKAKRLLSDLEKTILSGRIDLRLDGRSKFVNVEVNGQVVEMVFDTGASLITLPDSVARKLGISSSDRDIELTIADGSQISAKLAKLPLVRVGKFEMEEVDCAILGPEADSATPLLGMSFLENFEVNLYSDSVELIQIKSRAK